MFEAPAEYPSMRIADPRSRDSKQSFSLLQGVLTSEEREGSDVSALSDDDVKSQTIAPSTGRTADEPTPTPDGQTKPRPESLDAIKARLAHLEDLEDSNARQYEKLKLKRQRKDLRIEQRRDEEDRAIHALTAARVLTDEKIVARRAAEDHRFQQTEKALDAEENVRSTTQCCCHEANTAGRIFAIG